MFTFIIVTNRETKEIDTTIDILLKTKIVDDTIILVNYNNYSLKYRSFEGIDYIHTRQSRFQAVNSILPKEGNVVLLGETITITGNFVKSLYKHHDFKCLCALRVDNITNNGKVIESDYRIGSTITPKSFNHMAMSFNTSMMGRIGETPESTASMAVEFGIPLVLLPNVRTLTSTSSTKNSGSIGMTILIPSLKCKLSDQIKSDMQEKDRVYEFDSDPRGMLVFINQKIVESPNDCIVIVNPRSKIPVSSTINRIRGLFSGDSCILIDTMSGITDDAWLVIPKNRYSHSHKVFDTITQLQKHIISYNIKNITEYIISMNKKGDSVVGSGSSTSSSDMISIIIPFMYNGDRWPLFEASIERLCNCTEKHPNIEIVIHETTPTRHITPQFIEKYGVVYMFSEYHGLFHRAWVLNVPSRFLARGKTFVFFDGDLLVDDKWVVELLSCDKTKPYIGWGKMKNLNREGTNDYITKRILSEKLGRVREPDGHGSAGGINIIPRNIFFDMGGWPESYKDKGYGGEDNSLAFKMISLKMYDNNGVIRTLKSTVYHLFHGHETKRYDTRHAVFYKHKAHTKEEWLEHLKRRYDWGTPAEGTVDLSKFNTYVNETLLYVYKNSDKVRITVCMVNFLRYDKLINSLTTLASFNIPINVLLWVNSCDDMDEDTKKTVEGIMNKFSGHDIMYSKKNLGAGYPRYMMLNKARYEYNTDYVVTIDDDMIYQNVESLLLGATVMDQEEYKDYGAIGIWCKPQLNIVRRTKTSIKSMPPFEGFHDVDCLGAGTMTIRNKVLNTCNYDPQYIIGIEDWDFSMTILSQGWKLGLVCDPRYKPMNDISGNSDKYTASRWDSKVIENSKRLFKNKWGLEVK